MKNKILTDEIIIKLVFVFAFLLYLCAFTHAQSLDKISRRCPSPNSTVYSTVLVTGIGDITHRPCPSRASIFTGIVDFSSATVTGLVSGSGTATFLPIFTSASVLGNSPISWNGTLLNANVGTATIGNNTLANVNISNAVADHVRIGANTSAGGQLNVDGTASSTLNFWGIPATGSLQLGSSNAANAARFTLDRSTNTITVISPTFNWSTATIGVSNWRLLRTVTPGGTTGNVTINQMSGSVNFAGGQGTILVTNSTATATSFIFCTVQTNDPTATDCRVTDRGAGNFTIRLNNLATIETVVAFLVTN